MVIIMAAFIFLEKLFINFTSFLLFCLYPFYKYFFNQKTTWGLYFCVLQKRNCATKNFVGLVKLAPIWHING